MIRQPGRMAPGSGSGGVGYVSRAATGRARAAAAAILVSAARAAAAFTLSPSAATARRLSARMLSARSRAARTLSAAARSAMRCTGVTASVHGVRILAQTSGTKDRRGELSRATGCAAACAAPPPCSHAAATIKKNAMPSMAPSCRCCILFPFRVTLARITRRNAARGARPPGPRASRDRRRLLLSGPLAAPGLGRLELACLARLHVMPLPAKILQDPRTEHLLLERLERPVQAVAVLENYFDHECSV